MEAPTAPSRDYSVSGLPPEQLGQVGDRMADDARVASVTPHHDQSGAVAFLRVKLHDQTPPAEIEGFLREYHECFPELRLEPNVPFSFGGGPAMPML